MRWLVVVGVLGCDSGQAIAPSAKPPSAAPPTARLADARAWELGTHGARDYRKAAAIYDELCADGCGDATACRELIDLAFHERGILMTAERNVIPARLCDRGDPVACWVATLLGVRPEAAFTGDLTALCAAGDAKACKADATFDFGDPGHVLARPRPLAACNAGDADGCTSLFAGLWPYCSARNVEPGAACVDDRAREWSAEGGDPAPLLRAWQRLQSLCADGNAVACHWVPGREIDELSRCNAGDYAICKSLVNRGDERARALACAGGVTELCVPARPRPTLGVEESLVAREKCGKGDATACKAAAQRIEIPRCPI